MEVERVLAAEAEAVTEMGSEAASDWEEEVRGRRAYPYPYPWPYSALPYPRPITLAQTPTLSL